MANFNIPRRPLGKTGLEVSVLSFGGSPIGGIYQVCHSGLGLRDRGLQPSGCSFPKLSFYITTQSVEEDEGLKAVHEAFNSGINYFDTSPWYGELRAEIVSDFCTPASCSPVPGSGAPVSPCQSSCEWTFIFFGKVWRACRDWEKHSRPCRGTRLS